MQNLTGYKCGTVLYFKGYCAFFRKGRKGREKKAFDGEIIMAQKLMLQGTMSNVGKTLLTAGLCRIFRQDGYVVMPFKAQNMSLNSCITEKGEEMSRAQVMQAEAAGVEPSSDMNPLLLKPTGLAGSQVILQGRVKENLSAKEFYRRKTEFRQSILESFRRIEEKADLVLIEGAGSPVELNLRKDDLVNMGFAEMVDAPVLLVGDIDPGGVFAQLIGTIELLTKEERSRVKGLIVNKFRGDRSLFSDGIRILEEKTGLPVVGVVPYMELNLPDEDSMSERLLAKGNAGGGFFDLAVIRYPRISNFSDFDVFDAWPDMRIRYVTAPEELGRPDLLILPGSKNTGADLAWLKNVGLDSAILAYAKTGPVLGICGGYQMLGRSVLDPEGVENSEGQNGAESSGGQNRAENSGLGLLPVRTILQKEKVQTRTEGRLNALSGMLRELGGCFVSGYEIHMGRTEADDGIIEGTEGGNASKADDGNTSKTEVSDARFLTENGNTYGTYLHGFFDAPEVIPALRKSLGRLRGISLPEQRAVDYQMFKEQEYDRLAGQLRQNLDMELIRRILSEADGG